MRILPRLLACALRILWSLTTLLHKVDTIMASVADLQSKIQGISDTADAIKAKVDALEGSIVVPVATQDDLDAIGASLDAAAAKLGEVVAPPPVSDDSAV